MLAVVLHLLVGGRRGLTFQSGPGHPPSPPEPDFRVLLRVDDVMVRLSHGVAWSEQPARLQFVREIPHPTSAVPSLHVLLEMRARARLPPSPRHESGDPALRGKLMVGCEPALLAATLDAAARRCLLDVVDDKLDTHPELATIARRLSSQRTLEELSAALLHNARHDPLASVRVRNLEELVERFGSNPEVLQLTRAALTDAEPELRLAAAAQRARAADAGPARAVVSELAFGPYAGSLRAKAIKVLGTSSSETDSEVQAALLRLTRDADDQVRRAAFSQLRARGWQPDSGGLALVSGAAGELSLPAEKKRGE